MQIFIIPETPDEFDIRDSNGWRVLGYDSRRECVTTEFVAGESLGAQNQAAEVKLWAQRRGGELLEGLDKNQGGRPGENRFHDGTSFPKLADLGISNKQSHRWQAIASIPEAVFVEHIEKTKAARTGGGVPQAEGALRGVASGDEAWRNTREGGRGQGTEKRKHFVFRSGHRFQDQRLASHHRARGPDRRVHRRGGEGPDPGDDFRQFLEAPRPRGCQSSEPLVRRMVAGTEAEAVFEEMLRSEPGNQVSPRGEDGRFLPNRNHVTEWTSQPATLPITISPSVPEPPRPPRKRDYSRESKQGNSVGYALRRLGVERPDLLAKVKAREMSANAAMIEGGFKLRPGSHRR